MPQSSLNCHVGRVWKPSAETLTEANARYLTEKSRGISMEWPSVTDSKGLNRVGNSEAALARDDYDDWPDPENWVGSAQILRSW
jgi:hypothetical protein